ncbi:hypothetical protein QTP88_025940 [Uroleucon formosanum]
MPRRQTMELNENHTLLAYANDIIILDNTKQDTVNSMSDLMKVCKHIGLSINQEKTKYMFMTREARDNEDDSDLEVDGILFQQDFSLKAGWSAIQKLVIPASAGNQNTFCD